MCVRVAIQVSSARLEQVARHFYVVMFEIMQQYFQTIQGLHFGIQCEFH